MHYNPPPEQQILASIEQGLSLISELSDSTMKHDLLAAFNEYQAEVFRRNPHMLH